MYQAGNLFLILLAALLVLIILIGLYWENRNRND